MIGLKIKRKAQNYADQMILGQDQIKISLIKLQDNLYTINQVI